MLMAKFLSKIMNQNPYVSTSQQKITREIQIPVPWGFVAGKVYGDSSNSPVLCLHGWLDNCNSFDPILPLLPTDKFFVFVDFPGHGLSSSIPIGFFFSLLHAYAGTFPERVDKLILFDSLGALLMIKHAETEYFRRSIDSYFKLEKKLFQPEHSHTYENAKAKLLKANTALNDKLADIILQRGTKQLEDGTYVYLRDMRQSVTEPSAVTEETSLKFLSKIKAETIHLISDVWLTFYVRKSNQKFIATAFRYFNNCEFHERIMVGDNHYFHMYTPEKIISHIKRLLSRPPRPGLRKPVPARL